MLCRFQFRTQALTNFFHSVKREVSAALGPERVCKMGVGPRSAAFGALCGYDFAALAGGDNPVDILLPKHCERLSGAWNRQATSSEP